MPPKPLPNLPTDYPSDQEIIKRYKEKGFVPRPFSVHIEAHPPSPEVNQPEKVPSTPISIVDHLSVLSATTGGSSRSSPSTSSRDRPPSPLSRRVRQSSRAVLPDELTVQPGERLIIIQSYSDGWCVAARDATRDNVAVEIGAVPAWVFARAPRGLASERPLRETSLRIAVQSSRNVQGNHSVLSWTNM
jgi:hypothetical protein